MTRVCLKSNPDAIGTIVEDIGDGTVWVRWENDEQRWRVDRHRLIELVPEGAGPPQHHLELQLLDALDRLRDGVNLAIECAIRDIHRTMGKK